jgi:hypothetical protein
MEFNRENYSAIKEACMQRQSIEFSAPKNIASFEGHSSLPTIWTGYAPCLLPPDGYSKVFAGSGNDAKGTLSKLELLIHLDGGKLFYKASGEDKVDIKVSWPGKDNAE